MTPMVETVANIRGNKSHPESELPPLEHKCSGGKGSLMMRLDFFTQKIKLQMEIEHLTKTRTTVTFKEGKSCFYWYMRGCDE